MSRLLLACLILLAAAWAFASPASDCPALEVDPITDCVATGQGWVYARSEAQAREIAEDVRQAAADFERFFGREAPRGAVVASGTQRVIPSEVREALFRLGAQWHLPWLDANDRLKLQEQAVARSIQAQRPAASPEELAAMVQAVLAQGRSDQDTDRSALRHEIGHMLLIASFWPDRARTPASGHYGGPGPDWLDETAAILMESQAMADRRRQALASSAGSDDEPAFLPLQELFSAEHPAAALAGQAARSDGSTIRVIGGEDAARISREAHWFYVQVRGFADFLLETGGDASVFGSIATSLADGSDMESWLAEQGPRYRLPASIHDLETAWQNWLMAREDR